MFGEEISISAAATRAPHPGCRSVPQAKKKGRKALYDCGLRFGAQGLGFWGLGFKV